MGLISQRIFFDSCIVIYLVEEHPTFASVIESMLVNASIAAELTIQISELTEMECLVMPLRKANRELLEKFQRWFNSVEILPIGRIVFQQAAKLRADFTSLKTPDAIHLATALHHSCDEFWTNDGRLGTVAPAIVKNILVP
jgi:predicted nucleic acid-binding protein